LATTEVKTGLFATVYKI